MKLTETHYNLVDRKNTKQENILKEPKLGTKYTLTKKFDDIVVDEVDIASTLYLNNKEYNFTYYDFLQTYNEYHHKKEIYNGYNSYYEERLQETFFDILNRYNCKEFYDSKIDAEIARNEIYLKKIK